MVRFIIITVPPDKVADRISTFRQKVCEMANSVQSLAYPPHVTLRTGAIVPEGNISSFIKEFEETLGNWKPFTIRTNGLLKNSYPDGNKIKYFIGYNVIKDIPLASLNEHLFSYRKYIKSNRQCFMPHLTLAFDDLNKENFYTVSSYLDEHPEETPQGFEWSCDNVSLYSLTGKSWQPYHIYKRIKT